MLDAGAIGRLRHVVVTWNVENTSTRLRIKNWKTDGGEGGGALGNFASHSLHYLGMVLRCDYWPLGADFGIARRPLLRDQCDAEPRLSVRRIGQLCDELRVVSRLGSPAGILWRGRHVGAGEHHHRLHARLLHQSRAAAGDSANVNEVDDDPLDRQFPNESRIAPVSRLAKRFLDAIEQRQPSFSKFHRWISCSNPSRRRAQITRHRPMA